jgi:predicted XRE-type DNA-binding protein
MKAKTFANVWDALSDSPEEAATMKIRSDVMIAINDTIRAWDTTQAQAASRLGVTQPRLNDLLQGKINKFSLDTLLTSGARRSQSEDQHRKGGVTRKRADPSQWPVVASKRIGKRVAPCLHFRARQDKLTAGESWMEPRETSDRGGT